MDDGAREAGDPSVRPGGRGPVLELVLYAESRAGFLVRTEGAAILPLRSPVERAGHGETAGEGLGPLVVRTAKDRFGLDVDYLGLLAAESGERRRLTVCAVARGPQEFPAAGGRTRLLSMADLEARGDEVDRAALFATALSWYHASVVARELPHRVREAVDRSLLYLENHRSIEDGRWGWNLYMITLFRGGRPVMALVVDPLLEREFVATDAANGGASSRGAAAACPPVPLRRSTVSLVTNYSAAGRVWGERMHGVLGGRCKRILSMWAPALDLALISTGQLDGMICHEGGLLDVGGGMLLVAAAGGHVLDLSGAPLAAHRSMYGRPVSFVAAGSPELARELLDVARSA
ncbi:inositol monophosphatase family protein [Actinomadura sp. WMMA1423]|uniref:inositol monophosphatase family protein n=1 Tax=Actinomadura sp. WMMA1423 TaxID=2591108 RepID=UPI00143D0EF6|nr:inositol monophosphatase family protein [Actinomadura sp. WMMA1423]